jgi:ABC-type oligopeptide transport system substrate-binding subunit/tetratricopeptide (TPR) repeat protein
MSQVVGALVNERYRLEAEIGRGGMAIVYRALDTVLERDVAVKVMTEAAALGTEGRARLLNEARAAASLNHPNIVSVHDAGEAQGSPFIVMELVEGESLHDRPPQTLEDIISVARQVCVALEYAHDHDVVHRDLKPENVLLAPDGTAKLTDFGLARSISSRMTSEGTIIGSVFYLAPELALGQDFDGRADLYALGVMLYELTTGSLPFAADDPVAVISQHLHAPIVPPRAKNPDIPPALNALIVRMLSKSPQDRPASASEVLHILQQPSILDKEAVPAEELSVLERIERGRMVGREQEIHEARGLWTRALSGEGQMLLISGEPGIGKTRLVRELVTQAEISGGEALVGVSYEEGGIPYAPFRQTIREALRNGHREGFDLPEFVLADLLTLAPELRSRYREVPQNPPVDPQAEQQRLFENLVIFYTMLSNRAPLLIVLEDAHWADSGTLSLLRHLARHTRRQRVMLVATYREVELDQARPLHEVLLDLDRERLTTRLKLTRLSREATRELLELLLAEEISSELLDGIYRETEGNPFFIEEVCKALVESGKLYYEDGHWQWPSRMAELAIPQSVRVAIQSRVSKLPADSQETLHLAAILGREFDFDILAEASELDEETLIEVLESAQQAQLIEELSTEGGVTFVFEHRLIPTTLVEGLRTLQRRRLHRRVAAAIETLHPDSFEALAYHYDQAGKADKATDYLLKAGDRARALYAQQEAIDNYRQALDFLKDAGDVEPAARTLMKLGLTYHNAFDFKAARQAFAEGFAFWQRVGEVEPTDLLPPAPHPLRVDWAEPPTLDPGLGTDVPSVGVIDQLFSGLVEWTPEMGVVPDVARSWDVLEGGRKYVFHLRDDVRWSDGAPVIAGDFEYAWKRVLAPASESRFPYILYDIQGARAYHQGELANPDRVGVHALDETTLIVELEAPTGYFLHLLAYVPTYAVPRHVVEAHGAAWTELNNIATNGPFGLAGWEPGECLVLERNPDYHGRVTGNVERVECSLVALQPEKALQTYEDNGLEVVITLPPAEMDRARQRYAGEYVSGPWLITQYVGFDVNRPPFDDRRVRRAFTLATDRETLAHVTLRGYAFPATGGVVPPGMPGHLPGIGLQYDPERARVLLAEAGYPGGRGFPAVDCRASDDPGVSLLGKDLRAQWLENLGVEIAWKRMEFASLLDKLFRETPQMWLMGWVADYPDPDSFLRVSEWKVTGRWQNEAYDGLVEEARRVTDQKQRMKMYQEADRIVVQEAPVLPLGYGRFHMLVKPWVRKYPTSPIKSWFWKDVIIEPH